MAKCNRLGMNTLAFGFKFLLPLAFGIKDFTQSISLSEESLESKTTYEFGATAVRFLC